MATLTKKGLSPTPEGNVKKQADSTTYKTKTSTTSSTYEKDENVKIYDEGTNKVTEFKEFDKQSYAEKVTHDSKKTTADDEYREKKESLQEKVEQQITGEIYVVDYLKPSTYTATDGTITVNVRNGNVIGKDIKYQLGVPYSKVPLRTTTGAAGGELTFSSLGPGSYDITAYGYNWSDTIRFNLEHKENTDIEDPVIGDGGTETYGPKYLFEFTENLNNSAAQWRGRILERDYTGGETTVQTGGSPVTYSVRGEGDDIYENTILAANCNIQLICNTNLEYVEFSRADENQYLFELSLWNGSSYDIKWKGYLLPRSFTEQFGTTPHTCEIQATDKLGDLSGKEYAITGQLPSSKLEFFGGDRTVLQVLRFCFERIKMNLPIRVAVDIFEENFTSASTDTPFAQTYVDTDSYFDDIERDSKNLLYVTRFDKTKNMSEVIKGLLRPFRALLVQWDNCYYIVDAKSYLSGTTTSYVQYDVDGTQDATGSWTSVLDFKRPDQTDYFRWVGGLQSLTTTETYGDVNVVLAVKPRESLFAPFTQNNVIDRDTIKNQTLIVRDKVAIKITDEDGGTVTEPQYNNDPFTYNISLRSPTNGDTAQEYRFTTKYSQADALELKLDINISPSEQNWEGSLAQYVPVRWQLIRIDPTSGDRFYYNINTDAWSNTVATVNVEFGKYNGYELERRISFDNDSPDQDQQFVLVLFTPSLYYADLTSTVDAVFGNPSAVRDVLQPITTVDLNPGVRQIVKVDNTVYDNATLYYYELQNSEGQGGDYPQRVKPVDFDANTNPVSWYLIETQQFSTSAEDIVFTVNQFKNVAIQLLPGGDKVKDTYRVARTINSNNDLTLDYDLFHFDAPDGITDGPRSIVNCFFDSDRNKTEVWDDGGTTEKPLAEHLQDWLVRLSKQARFKISSKLLSDTTFSPITVLRDPTDDNRVFLPSGIRYNLITNQLDGELVEIGSDTAPTGGDFNDSDFATADFLT